MEESNTTHGHLDAPRIESHPIRAAGAGASADATAAERRDSRIASLGTPAGTSRQGNHSNAGSDAIAHCAVAYDSATTTAGKLLALHRLYQAAYEAGQRALPEHRLIHWLLQDADRCAGLVADAYAGLDAYAEQPWLEALEREILHREQCDGDSPTLEIRRPEHQAVRS